LVERLGRAREAAEALVVERTQALSQANRDLERRMRESGRAESAQRQTAAQLSDQMFAWNWIGFAIMLLGGFLLFSATATTFLENAAFLVKLTYLVPMALAWHIVIQRKARTWGQTEQAPALAKLAGLVELLLWLSVVTAAVLIPTY